MNLQRCVYIMRVLEQFECSKLAGKGSNGG